MYESKQVKSQLKPDLFIKGHFLQISWDPATILNVTHKQMSDVFEAEEQLYQSISKPFG
jgi:hypothetical protein